MTPQKEATRPTYWEMMMPSALRVCAMSSRVERGPVAEDGWPSGGLLVGFSWIGKQRRGEGKEGDREEGMEAGREGKLGRRDWEPERR
eukprot:364481-Chlamydomonas_euryale.AAC.3